MPIINGRGRVGIRRPSVIVTPSVVFDGLKLYLDAGKTASYPGTGTTWADISGNGYNATLSGPSGGYPSYNGSNAIAFDGVDDYGSISYTIQNQFTNKISINVWVRPTWFDTGNNDGVSLIAKNMPTIAPPYTIFGFGIGPTGKYSTSIGNGSTRTICVSTNAVSLNNWVNLCLTYDGSIIKLYKNGVQDPTTAAANYTLGKNTVPVTIGANNQTLAPYYNWLKGNIGVIQLYNKGLSGAEVLQNYNAFLGRFYPVVSDTDAQAFVVTAGLTSSVQANAINTLVTSMKAAGIWAKMKAVYPFVGGSAASHKWNLKDPRDLDAAYRLAFTAGWIHSATGARPNGTSDYANTFLNANIMTANSEHLSNYSRTTTIKNRLEVGLISYTSNKFSYVMFQHNTSNRYVAIQGGDVMISTTPTTGEGFTLSNRRDGAKVQRYLNNSKLEANSTGNGLGNLNYYLSAINGNSYFGSCEIAFGSIGDGLTDAEASSLYNAVQAFQTALGRQV